MPVVPVPIISARIYESWSYGLVGKTVLSDFIVRQMLAPAPHSEVGRGPQLYTAGLLPSPGQVKAFKRMVQKL